MLINFDPEPVKVQILSLIHETLLKCMLSSMKTVPQSKSLTKSFG